MKKILLVVLISLNLFGGIDRAGFNKTSEIYEHYKKNKGATKEDVAKFVKPWIDSDATNEKDLYEDIIEALKEFEGSTHKTKYRRESMELLNELESVFRPPSLKQKNKSSVQKLKDWTKKKYKDIKKKMNLKSTKAGKD